MKARNSKTARVGDNVAFRIGSQRLLGRVVEDRGGIGVAGRRLLRIRVGADSEAQEFELPAEEVALSL